MGSEVISGLVTVATAIIGVAVIAVLVSRQANTANVLQAGGQSFATALSAATAPVTGGGTGNLGFTGGSSIQPFQTF